MDFDTGPSDVVTAHVRRFNNAVRQGNWHTYAEGFAPDATVTFDGAPVPPMAGRAAIVAGYQAMPPDDTITVLSTEVDGDAVSVDYAWDADPATSAGTLDMRVADGLITRLVVRVC